MHKGSCLCGAVAFEVAADLDAPIACHCKQCRQQSGHYFSAVAAPKGAVKFHRDSTLEWYRHTDIATRGFCTNCGSTLFWRGDASAKIMVAMGSLDQPAGLRLAGHYWFDFKGDYYTVDDGLPQYEGEAP
ncbi:GFA family protein [Roseovarius sp. 2305UL8-3]|uniref:GFA family protein n=1 Tax=Roseovarius conchicola TaxID=3121636 RepID=UPI003526EBFC